METTLFKPALWQIPHIGSGGETALAEKRKPSNNACTGLSAATGMHGLPAALRQKIW